jgi:hypothetical protein
VAEMDFDSIVAAIREQQAIIAALLPQQAALTKQVQDEQVAVDAARASRDAISAALDVEQQKLDLLEQAYTDINALIREMESLLSQASQDAIDQAAETKSAVDTMFDAGIGVDYPIEGGGPILGREGTLEDIEAFNQEMEDKLAEMLQGMGVGDIFAPIKEVWNRFKGWISQQNREFIALWKGVLDWFKRHWMAIVTIIAAPWTLGFAALGYLIKEFGPQVLGWLDEHVLQPVVGAFQMAWDAVVAAFEAVWTKMQEVWNVTGAPVWELIKIAAQAFGDFWVAVWDGSVLALQKAWDIISGIFSAIWEGIDGYLIPVLELFQVSFLIVAELIKRHMQFMWEGVKVIWDAMVFFIKEILIPAFEVARDKIKAAWDGLGSGIKWTWDNVIHPVFTMVDWVITNVVLKGFDGLKTGAAKSFEALGTALRAVWDNVIAPVFGFFKEAFETKVAPAFRWLYENVVKKTWGAITEVFSKAWSGIASSIEGGVNFFISAFNKLADAVNKVASLLGIDQRVSHMDPISLPRFSGGADFSAADNMMKGAWTMPGAGGGGGSIHLMAAGGVLGATGGKAQSARAIVGEGSNLYPEYVIPTDPRYRQRAQGLYSELGRTLWSGDGLGDIFGAGKKMAGDAIGKGLGLLKTGAIKAIWEPVKAGVNQIINQIPTQFFKSAGRGMLNMVDSWIRGTDSAYETAVANQTGPTPHDGPGSWGVIPPFLARLGIPFKILSTYRPGATTRFTGARSWHALNRAIDLSGPSGMVNYNARDLLAINQAIYQGFKPYLKELIYGGPGAKNVFRGQDHTFSSTLMREHINHVHAALARGGFVVPRRPGGALLQMGEGLYNERVQVMPLDGRHDGGGDTYNFYGDLSFPNITKPDDADKFLSNLEALAGH